MDKKKLMISAKNFIFRALDVTSWNQLVSYFWYKYVDKNKEFEEVFSWDITQEKDYDPRDWWQDRSSFEDLKTNEKKSLYIFDQWIHYRHRNACVPVNVISAHINNHPGLVLSYKKVDDFVNYCESIWIWKENGWANTPSVVKAYVKKWNEEHPNNKIAYERLWYDSPAVRDALSKWYQLIWSRNTFPLYNQDKVKGRKIDLERYSDQERRGGHCQTFLYWSYLRWEIIGVKEQIHAHDKWHTSITTTPVGDWINCVNSYPVTHKEFNTYWHTLLTKHCENNVWNKWFYFIYPLDMWNEETIPKPETDYQLAQKLGIWNWEGWDLFVTRRDAARMSYRTLKLCKELIDKSKK